MAAIGHEGRLLGEAILMAYNDYADRTVAP